MSDLDEKLPLRRVLAIEGCSRSTLYERIAAGRFPKPILNESGRAKNLWWKSEIIKYQKAERERLDAKERVAA